MHISIGPANNLNLISNNNANAVSNQIINQVNAGHLGNIASVNVNLNNGHQPTLSLNGNAANIAITSNQQNQSQNNTALAIVLPSPLIATSANVINAPGLNSLASRAATQVAVQVAAQTAAAQAVARNVASRNYHNNLEFIEQYLNPFIRQSQLSNQQNQQHQHNSSNMGASIGQIQNTLPSSASISYNPFFPSIASFREHYQIGRIPRITFLDRSLEVRF
jgi:hypothetical protein